MKTIQQIVNGVNNKIATLFKNEEYNKLGDFQVRSMIQDAIRAAFIDAGIDKKSKADGITYTVFDSHRLRNKSRIQAYIEFAPREYESIDFLELTIRRKKVKASMFGHEMIASKIEVEIYNPNRVALTMDSTPLDVYNYTLNKSKANIARDEAEANKKVTDMKELMEKYSMSFDDAKEFHRMFDKLTYDEQRELKAS